MRKLVFCFCLFFASCGGEEEKPDYIYSVEKMNMILTEIHLVDKALVNARIRMDTATVLYHNHYLPEICEKYGVTKAGIDSSLKYYIENVEDKEGFQRIYESVVDSLSVLEIRK